MRLWAARAKARSRFRETQEAFTAGTLSGVPVSHRRACWAVPNGAPYGMRRARPFQPTDTKVMFAVRYDDGQSAYIRVTPEAARYGHLVVLSIAREQQKAGDIPDGMIVSVQQVR